MNRKMILAPLIVLLMLLSMASFVKADNTVSAASNTVGAKPSVVGEFKVTPSGDIQLRGYTRQIFSVLTIGGTPTYDVYSANTYDANWNPTTGTYAVHFNAVWYVDTYSYAWTKAPTWYTIQPTSGFAGNIELKYFDAKVSIDSTGKVTLASYSSLELHCTLQGFGALAGQTLKFDLETPNPPGTAATWDGILITP